MDEVRQTYQKLYEAFAMFHNDIIELTNKPPAQNYLDFYVTIIRDLEANVKDLDVNYTYLVKYNDEVRTINPIVKINFYSRFITYGDDYIPHCLEAILRNVIETLKLLEILLNSA